MRNTILFTFIVLLLMGCGTSDVDCEPSDSAIQTAIAETEIARPTATHTVIPTETPTVTPSPTPTEIPPSLTPSQTPTEVPTETPTPLPLEMRILGKWQGGFVNKNGDKVPAFWSFYEGGVMVTEITLVGVSYGGEWWVEGDRIIFVTEMNPNEENYRDIKFVDDDVMQTIKNDTVETWTRVVEE